MMRLGNPGNLDPCLALQLRQGRGFAGSIFRSSSPARRTVRPWIRIVIGLWIIVCLLFGSQPRRPAPISRFLWFGP